MWSSLKKTNTIHGLLFIYSGNINRVLKWIWYVLMMVNVAFTIVLVVIFKNRYDVNLVVTKVNPFCSIEDADFPHVAICNFNIVSVRDSNKIVQLLKEHGYGDEEIRIFITSLDLLLYPHINEEDISNYTNVLEVLKDHYYDVDSIMEEVRQKCEQMLYYCQFNGIERNCSDLFRLVKTLHGHCCSFNYNGISKVEDRYIDDEGFKTDRDFYKNGRVYKTARSGSGSGLMVAFDVEPDQYPPWTRMFNYGATVTIGDPADYLETNVMQNTAVTGEMLKIAIDPIIMKTKTSLTNIDPARRNCLFVQELKIKYKSKYSYETCCTECRIAFINETCGCIPFIYPKQDNYSRYCEFKDIPCLRKAIMRGQDTSEQTVDCGCLPECVDVKYRSRKSIFPLKDMPLPPKVTKFVSINKNLSALEVYYDQPVFNCYERGLYMNWNELLANYGCLFGLTLGMSFITPFEFLYEFFKVSYYKYLNKSYGVIKLYNQRR